MRARVFSYTVPADGAERFGKEWVRSYANEFPKLGEVPWFACRPGPPATEI